MKFLALYVFAASVALTSAVSKPGQCSAKKKCSDGAECVSVQNDVDGLSKASQCTLDPVCSGNQPGACPTFSSWPASYQDIQSVCSFQDPGKCPEPGEAASETDDTVDCFNMDISFDNSTFSRYGIYKCVTRALFERDTVFPAELRADALENCAGSNETEDALLCNGQGTCAPKARFSGEFECLCNLGFSSEDNCLVATSNACNNFGQCGEGGECNTSSGQCSCEDGIGGNQCSQCETDEACKNGGTCSDGVCTCAPGYKGQLCKKIDSTTSDATALRSAASLAVLSAMLMLLN